MKKTISGFTIVEVIAVITIIGIVSTISILSFSKVQGEARDNQRSTKIRIIAEALEKYYDKNGEYPGCVAMRAAINTVSSSTLKGVDPTNLTAPKATAGTNSIICQELTGASGDLFAYVGDNNTNCSTGSNCLYYKLQYKEEATGEIISLEGRRSADLAALATPTPMATLNSPTQITPNP